MKKRFRISYWLIVFFCLSLLIAPAGWAGQKIFVRIDGIPGDSVDECCRNWIVATSYSDGLSHPGNPSGGVNSPQPAVFDPVQITKSLDRASPKLRQLAAPGGHIKEVTIEIRKPLGGETTVDRLVATFTLTHCIITGVSLIVNETDLPKEVVTFDFGRIKGGYILWKPDGSSAGRIDFCWDREMNKSCL